MVEPALPGTTVFSKWTLAAEESGGFPASIELNAGPS